MNKPLVAIGWGLINIGLIWGISKSVIDAYIGHDFIGVVIPIIGLLSINYGILLVVKGFQAGDKVNEEGSK